MGRTGTHRMPGPATWAGSLLIANLCYSLLDIASLRSSTGTVAEAMVVWNRLLDPFVSRVLRDFGAPDCGGPRGFLRAYESLVVIETSASIIVFALSGWCWSTWARLLRSSPRWRSVPPELRDDQMAARQGLALLGAGVCAWLLLSGDPLFQPLTCGRASLLLLLRVPLLVATTFGLSSLAVVFGVARR